MRWGADSPPLPNNLPLPVIPGSTRDDGNVAMVVESRKSACGWADGRSRPSKKEQRSAALRPLSIIYAFRRRYRSGHYPPPRKSKEWLNSRPRFGGTVEKSLNTRMNCRIADFDLLNDTCSTSGMKIKVHTHRWGEGDKSAVI